MPSTRLDDLLTRIQALHQELEQELARAMADKRSQFKYTLEKGKIRFERSIQAFQREHKVSLFSYIQRAKLRHIASAPIIYSVVVPIALLDLCITAYQHSCFRLYGIPRVVRAKYVVIDRQHLAYLNAIEKLNCIYCGYGNGVIAYCREVIARTEQYWCPIKHAHKVLDSHRLSENFSEFGDAEGYRQQLEALRQAVREAK